MICAPSFIQIDNILGIRIIGVMCGKVRSGGVGYGIEGSTIGIYGKKAIEDVQKIIDWSD